MRFKVLKDFKVYGTAYKAGTVIDLPWSDVGLFGGALQAVPATTAITSKGTPVTKDAGKAQDGQDATPPPTAPQADGPIPPADAQGPDAQAGQE